MKQFTHNDLPEAVSRLFDMVEAILNILQNNTDKKSEADEDRWMTLKELQKYLPDKPSESDIYKKKGRNKIPFHKPAGRLLFLKSEIDAYLMSKKSKTLDQIEADVDNKLAGMRRKRK